MKEPTMVLIDIIKNTPIISHLILCYVIFTGIKALKTQYISVVRILILPFSILIWSIHILAGKITTWSDIALWLALFAIGIIIGWYMIHMLKIDIDKKQRTIKVEGSPLTLIFSLIVFSTKYFYGYLYSANNHSRENTFLVISDIATSGIISGIFFGRALCYIYRYHRKEHALFR